LVCTDPRFAAGGKSLFPLKTEVHGHFLTRLSAPAGPQSDRAVGIAEAGVVGHEVLFEALWAGSTASNCQRMSWIPSLPGRALAAEKEGLRALL
jgi:hypothetical protein